MIVIKRDGRRTDYNKNKITQAILKAMGETKKGSDVELAKSVATEITNEAFKNKDSPLSVEDIQDMVVDKLINSHRQDVGVEYVGYRRLRDVERQRNSDLTKKLGNIMRAKDIENSNANVDEASFSGKENKALEEIMEEYALNELISEDITKAHRDNRVYVHDLSKYASGMHNCLFVDIKDVLSRGFDTRNGDVRPPRSISSAMQLVAVIFQCQSQVMFGGVGTSKLDNDLVEYVKITFMKYFKEGLHYLRGGEHPHIPERNMYIDNLELKNEYSDVYQYAIDKTISDSEQGAQALYHNLNTLESRAGRFDCPSI